jgi:lipid-A-disaccharide synthase
MHIFFSVGEPSGDQHAAGLMREIRRRVPDARFSGFGGPLMQQTGYEELYRLTNLAVMGIAAVLPLLWRFYRLVRRAGRFLEQQRPDAVVLVDFPGFNWWIARKAKRLGIPVYYYMPPQLWAWAPWRIRKVRRLIDCVLAALPFEAEWYRERRVNVEYVGHPFFDEVHEHRLDARFCDFLLPAGVRSIGILPGSRNQEVRRNFPHMLEVMRRLYDRHRDVRFRVACYKPLQREYCQLLIQAGYAGLPIDLYVGRTSEIIETAECCLMVSGSVSLELLARGTPAVVMYRGTVFTELLVRMLVTCRFMTLPNLMAGRELMPEFPFARDVERTVRAMTAHLDTWLADAASLARVRGEIEQLRARVAKTGGIARAAETLLDQLGREQVMRIAA